ncbi:ABC transporter permease [Actinoalloteichus sp. AHMU CJ021]|uniref:Simple sugar transport system permease protein n=1 Tax=Actinoalloteichus caeruleus DSM 43889 TaxID=1120930 RepID=A0ABT1JDE1_ACTCY|nr:ABC transporter permease [Actinoalloteichus caeruleus]AUS81032.1 ABC transporter permease [Actinoalloteichus sp. AHMU CJ021]MCP2330504.1 simple sugar transport system permease protein [Actinoalloteichus caeruleus DSM 43889]
MTSRTAEATPPAGTARPSRLLRTRGGVVALAVLTGVVVGTLVLAGTGTNPLTAYAALATGAFGPDNLPDTLSYVLPVLGMATALAIPLRAGMVNLGGEGQLVLGAVGALVTGLFSPLPAPLTVVAALLVGTLAGASYAALAALCDSHLGVPLLVSSLLLSYPAISFASYLVRFPLADPGSSLPQSERLPAGVALPTLGAGQISVGLVAVLAVVAAYTVVDRRTPAGYEVRMTGLGARFASYAGIDRPRLTVRVLAASGGIAGLVGAILVLGFPFRFIDGALISPQYTWIGLMAALLAAAHPVGTAVAAFFFAALTSGAFEMERITQAPRELTAIVQALVIIVLATSTGLLRGKGGPR